MNEFDFFLAYEKRMACKRAVEVASDPLIFAGIKKWAQLNLEERRLFIARYQRLCERAMNLGMLKLEFFQEAPKNGHTSFAVYDCNPSKDGWGRVVQVNVHPQVLGQAGLESLLDTAPHELTHNFQDKLINNPDVMPELFRDFVPKLMKENREAYICSADNFDLYYKQPMEVHARTVGCAFAEAVIEFVGSKMLLPNNFNQEDVEEEYIKVKEAGAGICSFTMPHIDGLETMDPYRHFYCAKLHEAALSKSGGAVRDHWWSLLTHYKKAIVYGEYLPHDPGPALDGLYKLAADECYDDDKDPPRRFDVPGTIQDRARLVLEHYAEKGGDREAVRARRFLGKLQKRKPHVPGRKLEQTTAPGRSP